MTIEQVQKICHKVAAAHGYELNCPITANSRFRTTLGRVQYDVQGLISIEFSTIHLSNDSDAAVVDTILHELAHAFVYLEYGLGHGHDEIFRHMCARLGTDNDGRFSNHSKELKIDYKYSIFCAKCGKLIATRHRACKLTTHSEFYRSKCCGSVLKVQQNF